MDLIFLAVIAALTAGTALLVRLCDRLLPPQKEHS